MRGAPDATTVGMRSMSLSLVLLAAAAACSSPARVPRGPLGAADHLAEADRHEADARHHEELAASAEGTPARTSFACGDRALADQASSGGETLAPRSPCWTEARTDAERHHLAATRLRADARAHRAAARQLVGAAHDACAAMAESELEHSAFSHREDIAAVEAVLDGDLVRGARIRFERVPGLTADWLGRSLTCHQALAAASGFDATYITDCPSVIAGAETTVEDTDAGLVVEVRAADPAAALVVYQRAEALVSERSRGVDTHAGVLAPCHTARGRVATAASNALRTGDVRHALLWVDAAGEAEVRALFKQISAVHKKGEGAAGLAIFERYFIETVVRLHLAAHGEPYRGLAESCATAR